MTVGNHPFDLQRFVDAQTPVFEQACNELSAGSKQGHWMWFVFPQLRGLGHSSTAMAFGIASLAEARAYLEHPILGPRLRRTTELVTNLQGRTIEQIFGYPDYLKFRSSMALFRLGANEKKAFDLALKKYFNGEDEPLTVQRLTS